MSLAEILDEIPRLSIAERQELVRRAVAVDHEDLTPEEDAILDVCCINTNIMTLPSNQQIETARYYLPYRWGLLRRSMNMY